jgi:hypothetical protein
MTQDTKELGEGGLPPLPRHAKATMKAGAAVVIAIAAQVAGAVSGQFVISTALLAVTMALLAIADAISASDAASKESP